MNESFSIRRALICLLTPLVRLLLRNGVSFGTFSNIARDVYVQVAKNDFAIEGRKQSISRVAVITGMTRKAVKEVLEQSEDRDLEREEAYNRAARVIAGWRRDHAFAGGDGQPADLPISGDGASFGTLVKKYSGDTPARAVLDELVRVRAAEVLPDGDIRLLVRAYLPANDAAMKLHILGTDVGRLIETIGHNLDADNAAAFFQRTVAYDNLPKEALLPFHRIAGDQGQALLEKLDQYLYAQDRDQHPEIKGTGRFAAGISIFYFEEPIDNEE